MKKIKNNLISLQKAEAKLIEDTTKETIQKNFFQKVII